MADGQQYQGVVKKKGTENIAPLLRGDELVAPRRRLRRLPPVEACRCCSYRRRPRRSPLPSIKISRGEEVGGDRQGDTSLRFHGCSLRFPAINSCYCEKRNSCRFGGDCR